MADSFLTVAQQVVVLFLLIGVGVLLTRLHILNEAAVKCCTELALMIATSCVIIQSFMRKFDVSMLGDLGIAALVSFLIHVVSIGIVCLVFRHDDSSRRRVLRFAAVFSNAGYMGIPLEQAILGDIGVFYGATYIAVFNLVLWSYGLIEMSGEKPTSLKALRKSIINPGTVGLTIGLIIFLFSIDLPEIIAAPIRHLAALNTPLPMLVIGYYLAKTNIREALRDKRSYIAIALRLFIIPMLALGALVACGLRGTVLVSSIIAASAPTAAATTMFATKFNQDTNLSVNIVSLSTLISLITMPVVVGLAQMLS